MAGGKSNQAVYIKCTAKINGEERYVTGMEADIGINGFWPYVLLETHPKKDAEKQAIKLGTSDACQEMGKIQNLIFQERRNPDCEVSVSVEGYDAGSFSFQGMLIGGQYTFSAREVSRADRAIPDYAKITALSYRIYSAKSTYKAGSKPRLKDAGSFPKFILKAAEEVKKNWQENPNKDNLLSYKVAQQQNQLNEQLKTEFENLMNASDGEDKFGWQEAASLLKDLKPCGGDTELRARVLDILLGSDGPFESTITQIAEDFQCVYIPEWKKIGMLKNRGNLLKNQKDLTVDIVQISIKASNGNTLFPIKYVAVEPPASPTYKAGRAMEDFVAAPKENINSGCSMLRTPGPLWVSGSVAAQSIQTEGAKASRREKKVDIGSAEKTSKKVIKDEKTQFEKLYEILEKWCENEYVFQALSGSMVDIIIPLNFNPEIGICYKVKNSSGKELFTGILAHIRHYLSTGDGKSPNAYTALTFNIIQLPGFELPGAPK